MAAELGVPGTPPLLRQTARAVEALDGPPALRDFPELEKRVFLATSDFFRRSDADTLDALAALADVRAFAKGELITDVGDTCRELLLLIEGIARVHHRDGERTWVKDLQPGRVLDELQVLTHSASESTSWPKPTAPACWPCRWIPSMRCRGAIRTSPAGCWNWRALNCSG